MSKIIEIPCGGGTILVEVETPDGIVKTGRMGEWLVEQKEQAFDQVKEVIGGGCQVLIGALQELAAREKAVERATLEFGLQFTGEGKAFVVKAAAQASIKVSLSLKYS
jgi:hypothetical protein